MKRNHGDPIWVDLSTHDIEGATSFYAEVFGWDIVDQGEDYGHYHFATVNGQPVAGVMSSLFGPEGPTEEPTGPTQWGVSLQVDDIDEVLRRVESAGGTVVFAAVDVADLGRMAGCVDTTGAFVSFWQPKEFAGFAEGAGAPVWFELMARRYEAALDFYREVLGWEYHYTSEDGASTGIPPAGQGFRYATNGTAEEASAGICDAANLPEEAGSYWRFYLPVDDVDATCAKITAAGGSLLDGPIDSPFNRIATVADPQGASFQIGARETAE